MELMQNPSPPCSPPQRVDQFIQLVRDGLHLALGRRVTHGYAERADGVRVVTSATDGAAQGGDEVGVGDFAVQAVQAICSVLATRDAEREVGVRAIKAGLHSGEIAGVQGGHAIDDGIGHGGAGRASGARAAVVPVTAIIPTRQSKREVQGAAIPTHSGLSHVTGIERAHRVHARADHRAAVLPRRSRWPSGNGLNQVKQPLQLRAHLRSIHERVFEGKSWVEGHGKGLGLRWGRKALGGSIPQRSVHHW